MVKRKVGNVSEILNLLRLSLRAHFFVLFMSLLTASIVQSSVFLGGVKVILLRNLSWSKRQSLLIPNFDLTEKIGKVVI